MPALFLPVFGGIHVHYGRPPCVRVLYYREDGSPGLPESVVSAGRSTDLAHVAEDSKTILRHDKGNVGMEYQVTEMVKNQMQHNMALTVMNQQFRLLKAAISERF